MIVGSGIKAGGGNIQVISNNKRCATIYYTSSMTA